MEEIDFNEDIANQMIQIAGHAAEIVMMMQAAGIYDLLDNDAKNWLDSQVALNELFLDDGDDE